jgi:hypothetical protein
VIVPSKSAHALAPHARNARRAGCTSRSAVTAVILSAASPILSAALPMRLSAATVCSAASERVLIAVPMAYCRLRNGHALACHAALMHRQQRAANARQPAGFDGRVIRHANAQRALACPMVHPGMNVARRVQTFRRAVPRNVLCHGHLLFVGTFRRLLACGFGSRRADLDACGLGGRGGHLRIEFHKAALLGHIPMRGRKRILPSCARPFRRGQCESRLSG